MADHPNAELFRRGYGAFQSGDLETVRTLFADDIVWHIGGRNHFSRDYAGADNVLALFAENFTETDGTFGVDVHDILADDDHAVALATVRGRKGDKTLNDRYTHVVHIAGGEVVESWIFQENQHEVDEFWG